MERLRHKVVLATCLLLISFALLISVPTDRASSAYRYHPASDEQDTTQPIPRPRTRSYRVGENKPARKQFRAQNLTTNRQKDVRSGNSLVSNARLASSTQDISLELPELDFSNSDTPQSPATGFGSGDAPELDPILPALDGNNAPQPVEEPPAHKIDSDSQTEIKSPEPNIYLPKQLERKQPVRIAPAVVDSYLEKLRYANSLARRGAISSAFEELQGALKLLAEAIDQLQQTQVHTTAMQSGFVALREVSDLATWSNDLSIFVAGHETKVFKNRELTGTSFHEARLAYLGFAEKQLRLGCEDLALAAEAFRSMGKVFLMQEDFLKHSKMSQAKAMLMFRLAATVNPQDSVAARELGILYAKYNHFNEAKELLIKSLQVQSDSTTWQNLAQVHRILGESKLAWQATNESELAMRQRQKTGTVYWTKPSNFNHVQSMVDPPVMTARRSESNGPTKSTMQRNASTQRSFNQRNNRR